MTLDEAIKHCEEKAKAQRNQADYYHRTRKSDNDEYRNGMRENCLECAREHEQLAEWLKELKAYRENAPTVSDQSIEIAQKSIELGRKVGQLEGKLERPHSEWIESNEFKIRTCWCCNNCGYPTFEVVETNFCPNCGASMKPKTCTNCETFGEGCGDCEVGDDD